VEVVVEIQLHHLVVLAAVVMARTTAQPQQAERQTLAVVAVAHKQ
jgi:hypothetical protein